MTAGVNFALDAGFAVLVLYALHVLGVPASGFAVLFVAFAAGGALGGLIASRLSSRIGPGNVLIFAVTCACAALMATAWTSSLIVAAFGQALIALGGGCWGVVSVSCLQHLAPDHLLARVTTSAPDTVSSTPSAPIPTVAPL